jgi:chromosome segregation ATPase
MPRTGVSYDDVVESIHILEKAGLNASIRNIRERIGKGSLTTIAEHKREYEVATASAPREALPDPIAKGLLGGAETYWQELVEAAETEIGKIQAAADTSVGELTARVTELEGELADAQEALNGESLAKKTVEDTLVTAEADRSELEAELQRQSTEFSATSARLDEARQAVEKIEIARGNLAEQLKEAQGEVAKLVERSDNAASKHATELARLNTALAEASASNDRLAEQLEGAKNASDKAASEARDQEKRAQRAENENKIAQAIVSRLRDELEQQQSAQVEMRTSLEKQCASQIVLVEEKDARIADLRSANNALEKALNAQKKTKKKKQPT